MKRLFTLANFIFFTIALSAEVRIAFHFRRWNGITTKIQNQSMGMGNSTQEKLPLLRLGIIKLIPNILLLTENGI